MTRLLESKVRVVPLEQVHKIPGSVAITFDGGFQNFLDFGLPVLEQNQFPATVFVATAYCGDRNRWDRKLREVPKLPLMGWDDLAALPRPLIQLGAGSVTHPHLPALKRDAVITELDACRSAITHITQSEPAAFRYPYGASSPEIRQLVADRFKVACTDRLDYVTSESDPYALPRIDAHAVRDPAVFTETITGDRRWQLGLRRMFREVRSLLRSA